MDGLRPYPNDQYRNPAPWIPVVRCRSEIETRRLISRLMERRGMDLGLQGDVSLVTGSTSGLGRASAKTLCHEGSDVVVTGRHEKRLDETVAELEATGRGDVVGITGDLTVLSDIKDTVARTVDHFGGIDHLVVSTGGPPEGTLDTITDEEWVDGFELLVLSLVRLAREAEPHLSDGGGTIVNVSSISVKETFGSLGLGSAVRMPEIGIAKILDRDLGSQVRVNTVLTGLFETPRLVEHIEAKVEEGVFETYEDGLATYASNSTLDRVGEPAEMGDAVAYLSSERSTFITGTTIPIDGGITNSNV